MSNQWRRAGSRDNGALLDFRWPAAAERHVGRARIKQRVVMRDNVEPLTRTGCA